MCPCPSSSGRQERLSATGLIQPVPDSPSQNLSASLHGMASCQGGLRTFGLNHALCLASPSPALRLGSSCLSFQHLGDSQPPQLPRATSRHPRHGAHTSVPTPAPPNAAHTNVKHQRQGPSLGHVCIPHAQHKARQRLDTINSIF